MGSGCGTVGRAVASDTSDPKFEYSHPILLFSLNCFERHNKEKEAGNGQFFNLKGKKNSPFYDATYLDMEFRLMACG